MNNTAVATTTNRLDRDKIFKLIVGGKHTKKEIAELSNSSATTTKGKINSVSQVVKSSEFQLQLDEYKKQQKQRALRRVQKAEEKIDYEAMALDQKGLGSFLIANEKLLHESVKVSSEDEKEKQIARGSTDNLTTTELEAILKDKREKIASLEGTIEGEVVT